MHPTFPSPELTVNPMNGIASLDAPAYGGFTVGARIEGTKTLLEIDIARADGAPQIIRQLGYFCSPVPKLSSNCHIRERLS
ncbi:pYEATS domain-containing protein [Rhizobium glycinendophyticum]|uniref:pYEATS domain-containing protein n=1 Tax=Rhizobium glycinendophyticum TaxID=2589807 RepID=UPI003CCC5A51